jgi:3-dehydroquinate synthase
VGEKYAVISDVTTAKLHGAKLVRELKKTGLKASLVTFQGGDSSKTFQSVEAIMNEMLQNGFNRHDAIIAIGGGVTGDISGLVASLYMRGIPLIQIPTTLLAMADSSIGGKTGVNLQKGKNMAGTFYQPAAVFIDPEVLKTLPLSEMTNGMSEIVKTAIIGDLELFHDLEDGIADFFSRDMEFLKKIVERACRVKASIVEKDEKESGQRMKLNFGHTIGHALEKVSKYRIPHGQAVAVGMELINEISRNEELTSEKTYQQIRDLINNFKLTEGFNPQVLCEKNLPAIWETIERDKKATGHGIQFVIVPEIGRAEICTAISKQKIFKSIRQYRSEK